MTIKTKKAQLIVQNKSSADFGVYIQFPIVITHPTVDVTANSIPGHSGDLLSNNHRFANVTQSFNLYATKQAKYKTWSHLAIDLNQWLVSDAYQLIYLTTMHEWYWEGYLSAPISLTPQNDYEATGSISFNCKPYLRRTDSIDFQPVPNEVYNTELITAEPIFHIVGSGDFVIEINGQDYKLNGVDGEIYVDSQQQWIYKSKFSENRATCAIFPNNDFPLLNPGKNEIKLKSGNAQKFEYRPNWRRLA